MKKIKQGIAGEEVVMPDGTVRKVRKNVSYDKWGYIFIIPFFVIFIIFQLIPLFQTIYYSFFDYRRVLLEQVGPTWNNFANYVNLLTGETFWKYMGNTLILWILGAIPQFVFALLFAVWFTDKRLNLKFQGFFKGVVYMPNLIMATAFAYLFFMLLDSNGPITMLVHSMGWMVNFRQDAWMVRIVIALINVLMWTGNTCILLMSGIMGIDESIFESARLDGSGSMRTFVSVTMPLLMPIFVYVFVTSMIGGIQLFDAAQIYTQTTGGPQLTSNTIMMWLYAMISTSRNYGLSGALSVILFVITGILSVVVFKTLIPSYSAAKQEKKSQQKRNRWLRYNNSSFAEGLIYESKLNSRA
ncbi:MAG: sugar ABC transporter permease [Bacilli bacterium]